MFWKWERWVNFDDNDGDDDNNGNDDNDDYDNENENNMWRYKWKQDKSKGGNDNVVETQRPFLSSFRLEANKKLASTS